MASTFLHGAGLQRRQVAGWKRISFPPRRISSPRPAADKPRDRPAGGCRGCCRSSKPARLRALLGLARLRTHEMILDIGPASIWAGSRPGFLAVCRRRWCGTDPFGAFEMEPFDTRYRWQRPSCGRVHQSRQAHLGGRRWRHCGGAATQAGVADHFHLCFDRRRRLPGMDGRQGLAGCRGVEE